MTFSIERERTHPSVAYTATPRSVARLTFRTLRPDTARAAQPSRATQRTPRPVSSRTEQRARQHALGPQAHVRPAVRPHATLRARAPMLAGPSPVNLTPLLPRHSMHDDNLAQRRRQARRSQPHCARHTAREGRQIDVRSGTRDAGMASAARGMHRRHERGQRRARQSGEHLQRCSC